MSTKDRLAIVKLACASLVTFLTFGFVCSFNVDVSNPIVIAGPDDTYFGYAVAVLRNSDGIWIIIGAPKAWDPSLPDLDRPGLLYRCSKQGYGCEQVIIDDKGNVIQTVPRWDNATVTVHHNKDNQWLGATLDINARGDSSIVVCAPRWKDREFHVQGHEFMNGLCYRSASDLRFHNGSMLPVLEHYRNQIHQNGHFRYGMGLLGFSGQYSKDGSFLLLGTPGLNDWTGGFVRISVGFPSKPDVFEPRRATHNNSYIGYSVTTARLSSDAVFIVAGAPRAENKGKVFVYDEMYEVVLVKESDQFGSYFGASVCAADLNGDSLDDLVVGAPLYTSQSDEGRVFVYINREFFSLEFRQPALSGSNSPGARFGTTVANIGDLNMDGFEDIAVGAPFEDDMAGAVYIYNGAKSGLHSKYSQRIMGREIRPSIRAFGWSFSRPMDVDENYYPDFVVGAFASNDAVLLHTRPVVDFKVDFHLQPEIIDPDGKTTCLYKGAPVICLRVFMCMEYRGINLPDDTLVEYTLRLDTLDRHRNERRRLFFLTSDTETEDTKTQIITLRRRQVWCDSLYIVFTKKFRDVFTPLQLELEYRIPSGTSGISADCNLCPILNVYEPTTVTTQANFLKDCGPDDKCIADLVLRARPRYKNENEYLLIDDSPAFEVEIELKNLGETAYLTVVTLTFPETLQFSRLKMLSTSSDVTCLSQLDSEALNDTSHLECDLDRPLGYFEDSKFSIRLYANTWMYEVQSLNVTVQARTANEDGNIKNNGVVMSVPVRLLARMKITEASLPAQLDLPISDSDQEEKESDWQEIKHVYDLRNHGPSPFPYGHITILLPFSQWVQLVDMEVVSENPDVEVPTGCRIHQTPLIAYDFNSPAPTITSKSEGSKHHEAVHMACTPDACVNITCYVGLIHPGDGVYFTINLNIRRSVLRDHKAIKDLRIVSKATLKEADYDTFFTLSDITNSSAVTYVNPDRPPRKAFKIWVLAVSITCGLLLLYLIGVILWKCGFFRRKKREELQKLILSAETEREANTVSLPSHDPVNDIMVLPPTNHFTSSIENISYNHNNHWPPPHPAFSNDTYLEPINMKS